VDAGGVGAHDEARGTVRPMIIAAIVCFAVSLGLSIAGAIGEAS
jgi:hypothetical protein